MKKDFIAFCKELEQDIEQSYQNGITCEEAEKMAGKFLTAQVAVATQLQDADLDARMRKSGNKAVRAAVYIKAATSGDKKPTEAMLTAIVDLDDIVQKQQAGLDEAEVKKTMLQNYLSIFQEAHIHFRGIAKGRFDIT